MTHHYIIEIISTKTILKATYRNRKFRKLEHLRGKLDRKIMDALGKVIPITETEFSDFNKKWLNKVNYQIEVKGPQSLYTQFKEVWTTFFKKEHNGNTPKHGGAETNALKQIVSYFKSQTITEDEALENWRILLDNWEYLSEFHKKQVDLKYINSKLNVIIRELQTKNATTADSFKSAMESETAKGFKFS